MKGVLLLSFRYLQFNKGKTLLLVTSLSMLMLLPLTINKLVNMYNQVLLNRADATPFIIGNRGNRYDLVLKTLYQYTEYSESIHMGDVSFLKDSSLGTAIPLHLRYTAQKFHDDKEPVTSIDQVPILGTDMNYFEFRKLKLAEGTPPLMLGDAVVGARAAQKLGLTVGQFVLSTPHSVYDQSQSFQLKMPVVGILKPTDTPDDDALFTDIKTTWVIDGIGHGHDNIMELQDSTLINRDLSTDSNVVSTVKIVQYQEITDGNRAGFHFHGEPKDFPVTAIIFLPNSKKNQVMTAAYYSEHLSRMLLVPTQVINELMGFVFKIRQFINANYILVYFTVFLLTALIFSLSFKLRQRELETMYKIGSSKSTTALLILTEISFILIISAIIAWSGTLVILKWTPTLIQFFF